MKKDFFYRLNNAVHLLRAGATAGLYCTVGYAHIVCNHLRGVNRLSFCLLSWGRWNVFAGGGGIIRLKNHHCRKKYQASLSHHQPGRRPSFVFNFFARPCLYSARDIFIFQFFVFSPQPSPIYFVLFFLEREFSCLSIRAGIYCLSFLFTRYLVCQSFLRFIENLVEMNGSFD